MSNGNGSDFAKGIGVGAGYAATAGLLGIAETVTMFLIRNPEMIEAAKEKYYEIIMPPEGVVSRVWK